MQVLEFLLYALCPNWPEQFGHNNYVLGIFSKRHLITKQDIMTSKNKNPGTTV